MTATAVPLTPPLDSADEWQGVEHVRVAIIGAGFSGLGMAIALKRARLHDFVLLERGDESGGTWRDNTYPGCACDVESDLYSFSFAPNPDWSRHFSPQPEIWAYLRRCVGRFGLWPHIRRDHALQDATWDDAAHRWRIATDGGPLTADVLILATGPLSEPVTPAIPGLDRFAGTIFHSARWDHRHDLTGERVAVVGTGASAIQFVPQIQPQVGQLILFQRTPPWIVPRLDRPVLARRRALYRALPLAQRLRRWQLYWRRELSAIAFVRQPERFADAEGIAARHLARQVPDPALRAKLTPNYRMGCKRILLSDDFYPALTRENVAVVTAQIREVRAHSIVAEDGTERPVDTIILATGFRATDPPFAAQVRGRDGRSLADAWRDGQRAYLGTTVAGFPNLFICLGPNTGLGHSSMIVMIESQVAYIRDALRTLARQNLAAVEVRADVQEAHNADVQRHMARTIWSTGCKSWYLDAHGRNTTLWPGFTWQYRLKTRRFDAQSYRLTPHGATGGSNLPTGG